MVKNFLNLTNFKSHLFFCPTGKSSKPVFKPSPEEFLPQVLGHQIPVMSSTVKSHSPQWWQWFQWSYQAVEVYLAGLNTCHYFLIPTGKVINMYFLHMLTAFCIRRFGTWLVKVAFHAANNKGCFSRSTLCFLKLPFMRTLELTYFIYDFFLTLESSENSLIVFLFLFTASL